MRDYEPIWHELKQKKVVRVTANRRIHARILKAVTKEKWMDIGYKLMIEPYKTIMTHTSTGAILELRLKRFKRTPLDAEDF